ncbi:hypothetical protein P7C70_g3986, partial [Phenoliferia sp. Uapishka_3]
MAPPAEDYDDLYGDLYGDSEALAAPAAAPAAATSDPRKAAPAPASSTAPLAAPAPIPSYSTPNPASAGLPPTPQNVSNFSQQPPLHGAPIHFDPGYSSNNRPNVRPSDMPDEGEVLSA